MSTRPCVAAIRAILDLSFIGSLKSPTKIKDSFFVLHMRMNSFRSRWLVGVQQNRLVYHVGIRILTNERNSLSS